MEWIGKEISGAGMDPAVVGRVGIRSVPDPGKPFVNKLAVLGVTEDSYGNAVGLGNADYTTLQGREPRRSVADVHELDHRGGHRGRAHPGGAADDRTVIRAMVATCWRSDLGQRAPLPDPLDPVPERDPGLAGALRGLEGRPDVERLSDPEPLQFSADGELLTRV